MFTSSCHSHLHDFLSPMEHRHWRYFNVALQTRLDPTDLHCILCSTLACTFTEVKSSMCLLLFVLSCNSLNLPLKVCRFSQGRIQTECFKCQTKRAEYHGFLNDILRLYSRLPGCSRKLMNVGPCRAQEKTGACSKQDHLKPSKQENKVEKRIKNQAILITSKS